MGSTIASIAIPALFIVFGVLIVAFRTQIARWYRGMYETTFGTSTSRPARAFNSSSMLFTGSFAIVAGCIFLVLAIQRAM